MPAVLIHLITWPTHEKNCRMLLEIAYNLADT